MSIAIQSLNGALVLEQMHHGGWHGTLASEMVLIVEQFGCFSTADKCGGAQADTAGKKIGVQSVTPGRDERIAFAQKRDCTVKADATHLAHLRFERVGTRYGIGG